MRVSPLFNCLLPESVLSGYPLVDPAQLSALDHPLMIIPCLLLILQSLHTFDDTLLSLDITNLPESSLFLCLFVIHH